VRINSIPITPDKILDALREKQKSAVGNGANAPKKPQVAGNYR
jgi:hypothetical protein